MHSVSRPAHLSRCTPPVAFELSTIWPAGSVPRLSARIAVAGSETVSGGALHPASTRLAGAGRVLAWDIAETVDGVKPLHQIVDGVHSVVESGACGDDEIVEGVGVMLVPPAITAFLVLPVVGESGCFGGGLRGVFAA